MNPKFPNEDHIKKALDQMLEVQGYDTRQYPEETTDLDEEITEVVLSKTKRQNDGRLVMPLIWKSEAAAHLGENFHLARSILRSLRKLPSERLQLMDGSISEWLENGFIEEVTNIEDFRAQNPDHSFLSHMGVFRPDRETTKCRVVFLSNLCERNKKGKVSVSHNQAIHPGPNLNHKLTTAFIHLRFGDHLICYDLKKAFLNIALYPEDTNKLLFL